MGWHTDEGFEGERASQRGQHIAENFIWALIRAAQEFFFLGGGMGGSQRGSAMLKF